MFLVASRVGRCFASLLPIVLSSTALAALDGDVDGVVSVRGLLERLSSATGTVYRSPQFENVPVYARYRFDRLADIVPGLESVFAGTWQMASDSLVLGPSKERTRDRKDGEAALFTSAFRSLSSGLTDRYSWSNDKVSRIK